MTAPRIPPERISLAKKVRRQLEANLLAPESGCSATTQRCADARSYGSELRPCCRGHLRQIVADVLPIIRAAGVVVWADYGTLLGAVRNPLTTWKDYPWLSQENRPADPLPAGIIPHDKDGDFGVTGTDFTGFCRMRRKIEKLGYHVKVRPKGRSMKVLLSRFNQTNVDFFNWFEMPNGMMYRKHYIAADQFKGREFHKDALFPLATVEWEGMSLPAPKDPVAFCEFRYGVNWRTPVQANHDGLRRR